MMPDDTSSAMIATTSGNSIPEVASPVSKPNWFLKHWRGEETLGFAYWRNSVVFANILPALAGATYFAVDPFKYSLQTNTSVALAVRITLIAIWIWGIVGVIRSANRHTSRGGSLGWANVARVMIFISVIGVSIRFYHNMPGLWLEARLAAGRDPMPKVWINMTLTKDGEGIWSARRRLRQRSAKGS